MLVLSRRSLERLHVGPDIVVTIGAIGRHVVRVDVDVSGESPYFRAEMLPPGTRLHIGPDIVITIVAIEGERVRIGVDAPDETPILRAELLPPGERPTKRQRRESA